MSVEIPFPSSQIPAVNVSMVPQRSHLRYPGGKTWLVPHIREWLASSIATCRTDHSDTLPDGLGLCR